MVGVSTVGWSKSLLSRCQPTGNSQGCIEYKTPFGITDNWSPQCNRRYQKSVRCMTCWDMSGIARKRSRSHCNTLKESGNWSYLICSNPNIKGNRWHLPTSNTLKYLERTLLSTHLKSNQYHSTICKLVLQLVCIPVEKYRN